MNFLDPTHPQTQAFLRNVFTTYRKWGVRYYMIDFLNAICGNAYGQFANDGYSDRSLIRGPQAWREGLRVIREAAGPDTYLLASSGPTLPTIGLMDAVRAGNDYGEGRALDGPGKGFYPGTFVIDKPDHWTSHSLALKALAGYFFTDRKLFLADTGNVLTVDQPMPVNEAQFRATFFGINGSPMMLGDDIDRIGDERLAMIRRVLPRLPGAPGPSTCSRRPTRITPKSSICPSKLPGINGTCSPYSTSASSRSTKPVALDRLGLDPQGKVRAMGLLERALRSLGHRLHHDPRARRERHPAAHLPRSRSPLARVHRYARAARRGGDSRLPLGRGARDVDDSRQPSVGRTRQRFRARPGRMGGRRAEGSVGRERRSRQLAPGARSRDVRRRPEEIRMRFQPPSAGQPR